jgi:hypothetical protein
MATGTSAECSNGNEPTRGRITSMVPAEGPASYFTVTTGGLA